MKSPLIVAFLLLATLLPMSSHADGAFIDRRLTKDTGGVYRVQDAVPIALSLFSGGCALWEGSTSPLGRSCWESGESVVITALTVEALQFATGRESPMQTSDPGRWFQGRKGSFPSLHVAGTMAAVTPFIINNWDAHPVLASALIALPAYEMLARVKAQEHWQTDVLAGALIGAGVGYFESKHGSPLILSVLPDGGFVGIRRQF